ncbi:hypothetical protein P691DRAFT_766630 [Macrolepiota fuliginosa MF-IS2]|uniref:Uncharacterized protein n=1 Tax=Macrolepiota fuliginosa MF-IS2 TaxID=1400762 RepID=A0A9P6BVV7_9AGAR|nr:hypothetical protein P691DRAFT_766630 [Macrolepiota fuliginosa MF-IS2]
MTHSCPGAANIIHGLVFIAQTGKTHYYWHLVLAPGTSANLTLNTVAKVLIHNGVDPREINHSYTFGMNNLEQIYINGPIHHSLFNVADDHHLHTLQLHGVPPAIPRFNGWTLPSEIDLIWMYYFKSRMHSEENHEIMDVSGWKIVGDPYHPFIISNQQYLQSIQDFWKSVSKCRPQSFRYKLLGPTAPLLSLNPNIARLSSLAPGNGFTTIKQEALPLDETVEPDSNSLDNEPVDIDVPESTSMMVDTLPYGEVSPATVGHMTPEPQSTSEDISSSGESTPQQMEAPPPPMPKLDWADNQPPSA